MSKHYSEICNKVLQSNKDLHSGPNSMLQELQSVRKDIDKIYAKLNYISDLLIQIKNKDDYTY